ncbi:MAG: hypothetical protein AAGF48_12155, partial [Pseudomonadota bacterium]
MSAFAAWGCGIDISNINRRERRRALSLRKRGLTQSEQASRTAGPNSSLRALSYGFKTASPRVLLLGTAAVGLMLFGYGRGAYAQVFGGNCSFVGGSATLIHCTGDATRTQNILVDNAEVYTVSPFNIGTSTTPVPNNGLLIRGAGELSFFDQNASNIYAGDHGLYVVSNGDSGSIPGGIDIYTTGTIVGGNDGILADNQGAGLVTITAKGDVTGMGRFGIVARNDGTDIIVETGELTTTSGHFTGIDTRNFGTGSVTITAKGDVTGTQRHGIYAYNSSTGTDINVDTAAGETVKGRSRGIYAKNYGAGSVTVTANGDVTGTDNYGIDAYNSSAGTDITIHTATATTISGGFNGIRASNHGAGSLTITAKSDVTGMGRSGIVARNEGTDIMIETAGGATVRGQYHGIFALNRGTGSLTIAAKGDVTGADRDGIYASNSSTGTDIRIETGRGSAVTAGYYGIYARNRGTGSVTIDVDGDVTSEKASGIFVDNAGTHTVITIGTEGRVTSLAPNTFAYSAVDAYGAPVTLTLAGTIEGGAGGAVSFDQYNDFDDRLELQPGFEITRSSAVGAQDTVFAGGGTDTLAFGGTGEDTFDLGLIDTGAGTRQFRGFDTFGVESGTWSFSGATDADFTVSGGTLGGNGTFGGLNFTGGTLAPGDSIGAIT